MKKKVITGVIIGLICTAAVVLGAISISNIASDFADALEKNGKRITQGTGIGDYDDPDEDDPDENGSDVGSGDSQKDKKTEASARSNFLKKTDTIMTLANQFFIFDEVSEEEMYDAMLSGLMSSLGDMYTFYYDAEDWKSVEESMEGEYCGMGATISQDYATRTMTIVKPFKDSPAAKAGMLPGDELIAVDGESVVGEDVSLAVSKIKGPAGTHVTVTVLRDGKEIDFDIERALITIEYISYKMLEDNIGYIFVESFEGKVDVDFENAVKNLKAQGMKGLIVDMRDNPGGYVDISHNMLELFVPEGSLLMTDEYKSGYRNEYYSDREPIVDVPVVVLVNGNSASSTEIFTGCLKSYGLATIVGTRTFGKGIEQTVYPFDDGTGFQMTILKYFLPSGECIHEIGIEPDVEVELDEELRTTIIENREHDNQIDVAVETLKKKMK